MSSPPEGEFGHHFLIGLRPAVALEDADKRLLEQLRPAGVIVYRGNFDSAADYPVWLERFSVLLQQVRACIGRDDLLVCIDHEGGRCVRRRR